MRLFTTFAAITLFTHVGLAQLPAFPGAEGFGTTAVGGREGDVYHVTNLSPDADIPGSFAHGLKSIPERGRTLVFDVSGYIPINGRLTLDYSKVTIAGQTAPGGGIGFKGGTFLISASHVVIRHVRFRNGRSADTLNLDRRATNCIVDHCDVLLGKDENLSSFRRPSDYFTFSWSINAWGMENHSAGGLWDFPHATSHHSLWSHNHTRNPKARSILLEWINNITFDYDIGFILGDSQSAANWKANVVGSWFISPPGNLRRYALEKARLQATNGLPNFGLFIADSAMDANGDGSLSASKDGYAIASGDYHTNALPFPGRGIPVSADDRLTAYKKVISAVGPLRLSANSPLPLRDELNARLVANVVDQRRHHVSDPTQTGAANDGYGELDSGASLPDRDRDGMPDVWEIGVGSNPERDDHTEPLPAGSFLHTSANGYTRLEEYLHFLASPHGWMTNDLSSAEVQALEIDLSRYTAGFTKTPVHFGVSGAVNGRVNLLNDNKARFELARDLNHGRARFTFTVTDGDSSTWSQSFYVLVATGTPGK